MSKATFNAQVTSILEREFDVRETLKQLNLRPELVMCWGISSRMNYYDKGLLLNVNGRHVKGFVFITLAFDDTYTVRFLNAQYNEAKPMITNVYFDELAERIDRVIEYCPEYRY